MTSSSVRRGRVQRREAGPDGDVRRSTVCRFVAHGAVSVRLPPSARSGSPVAVVASGAGQSSRALVTASVETCLCCRTGIFAPPATVSECAVKSAHGARVGAPTKLDASVGGRAPGTSDPWGSLRSSAVTRSPARVTARPQGIDQTIGVSEPTIVRDRAVGNAGAPSALAVIALPYAGRVPGRGRSFGTPGLEFRQQ